jgi:hypothetical protein
MAFKFLWPRKSGSVAIFHSSRCFIFGMWHQATEALRTFRHLSTSIALKRNFLPVDLTVSLAYLQ